MKGRDYDLQELLQNPPEETFDSMLWQRLDDRMRVRIRYHLKHVCPEVKAITDNWEQRKGLIQEAKDYFENSGEKRDYKWEEDFAARYNVLRDAHRRNLTVWLSCQHWYKVMNGRYNQEIMKGEEHALHVIRLAETQPTGETIDMELEQGSVLQPDTANVKEERPMRPVKASETTAETTAVNAKSEKKNVSDEKKSGDGQSKDNTGVEGN